MVVTSRHAAKQGGRAPGRRSLAGGRPSDEMLHAAINILSSNRR
jgi:hypothetical protein